MPRLFAIAAIALLAIPTMAAAGSLGRMDALRTIWQGVRRPIEETNEPPFPDVVEGPDASLLTYLKSRGLLDAAERFRPADPVALRDALVWLLRTRNVAPPEDISSGSLLQFVRKYDLHIERTELRSNPPLPLERLDELAERLDSTLREEVHEVSFYSEEFRGDHTAFGEVFDPDALTAAHRLFPWNTLVRVTDVESGKSVVVRISDRGPYVEGRDMDLSRAAFVAIAPLSKGVTQARFDRLGDAGNDIPCTQTRYQRRVGTLVLSPGVPTSAPVGTTVKLRGNYGFSVMEVRSPDGSVDAPHAWLGRGRTYQVLLQQPGQYAITILTGAGRRRTFTVQALGHCTS